MIASIRDRRGVLIAFLIAGSAVVVPARTGTAAGGSLSLSPDRGPVGASVRITGEGLAQATTVRFGGVRASYVVRSDRRIVASVPPRARTGFVEVRTPNGKITSEVAFSVLPTIVFVLTDDQRWDTLRWMPVVTRDLVRGGVRFANAFSPNPLCCPSRASFLTGRESHDTGVWTNVPPDGGFGAFADDTTIATVLDAAGYRTGLFGKYLNGYWQTHGTYVPPGWDRWRAFAGGSDYYDYSISLDGRALEYHGSDPRDYSTDVLATHAERFIRKTPNDAPLFVWFAPAGVHAPFTPAPRHVGTLDGIGPWRPPSYDERDVSDKPAYIQAHPRLNADARQTLDAIRQAQLETLRSIDQAVRGLERVLAHTGRSSDTIFVFASDNGFLWGEHRLQGKEVPYEESIRIPMVIRWDRLEAPPPVSHASVLNIDLPVTLAEAAGTTLPGATGSSLLPLVTGTDTSWRSRALIEHLGSTVPSYCGIRTAGSVFVHLATGEEEYYRLGPDPDQSVNRIAAPRFAERIASLRDDARTLCDPLPPGMPAF